MNLESKSAWLPLLLCAWGTRASLLHQEERKCEGASGIGARVVVAQREEGVAAWGGSP